MIPILLKGVIIVTADNDVETQVRQCQTNAVVLRFKSFAATERYFDRHLLGVDVIYIDIDSVETPVPIMAYMIGLWRRHFDIHIYIISKSVEKLMSTGVERKHYVVFPLSSTKS